MSKNKNEKKTPINRTTSETLRLGGDGDIVRISSNTSTTATRKKIQSSSSSFQIIGVSLTRPDFGDDSADDLDESHTDDISRVTDNETPSFSEDSRDIDEQQVSITIAVQPSLPAPVETTEETPRFKVVKLPNYTVPYTKGRWTCVDFLDENAVLYETGSSQDPINSSTAFFSGFEGITQIPKFLPSVVVNRCQESRALLYANRFVPDLSLSATYNSIAGNQDNNALSSTGSGPSIVNQKRSLILKEESEAMEKNTSSDVISNIKDALTSTLNDLEPG